MSGAPTPGSTFGPYRVERLLGHGGMGAVFLAHDPRLNRPVALKVLLERHAQEETYLRRFQREAAVMARLDSPHVLSVFDHGVIDGWPYLVTQYAAGGDLATLLAERGPLPPALAARVCSQVADALAAAHAVGVVHRDVKAANVLVRDASPEQAGRIHVYLGDFGVAHDSSGGLTTAGAVAGTWNYLAPERAEGSAGTPLTDVYSVGCLFWETLTGRPPYAGSDVEVAMAHLTEPVPQLAAADATSQRADTVLARAMAKDPAHRPASALALREELRALVPPAVAPSFSGGPALGAGGPAAGSGRRGRGLLAGALALVLVAGGVTAGVLLTRDDEPAPTAGTGTSPDAEGDPDDAGTTAPPAPEPAPAVTGDLDGDGLGDVGYLDRDRGVLLTWRSTGSELTAPQGAAGRRPVEADALAGDLDGDGGEDLVEVDGDGAVVAVRVRRPGQPTVASPVPVTPGSSFLLADVTGDGVLDLVASSVQEGPLTVTVAVGDGAGGFGQASSWFDGPVDTGESDTAVVTAADLDGDAAADLVVAVPGGSGAQLRVLTAARGRFRAGGSVPAAALRDDSGTLLTADLAGDGAPELVYVTSGGIEDGVVVWPLDGSGAGGLGTSIRLPVAGGGAGVGDAYADEVALSDVDGDGRDDLVLVAYDSDFEGPRRAVVLRSLTAEGGRPELAAAQVWARDLPDEGYSHVLGPTTTAQWSGY
ncbi:protein kinase domain-containing protein [Nocardioides nanhaiensis]|uniref:non-specific serine/threonine protein kinase n=1 Tax=Nocardioides nanhaiensis TaxID=1476871 RepID=A0ABP8VSZ3_9ACTN